MYELQVKILRYGVIIGLIIVIIGLLAENQGFLSITGLSIIVLTPLTSLITISLKLLKEKQLRDFTLSLFTITVIIASIILSLLEKS